MIYDLHCHTNCSDGDLTTDALVALAVEKKVDVLSITDHDTILAYKKIPGHQNIKIIPGVEFSTQWQKTGIHIIGLNIQLEHDAIEEGVIFQKKARQHRAEKIAEKLKKLGLDNALEGAKKIAGEAEITRPHFAKYMVESGFSKSIDHAFKKHLGSGKAGDIKQLWAPMDKVINWIRESGGVAVLAHPHKYQLTRTRLIGLLEDFKLTGGQAMEVLSGAQEKNITEMLRDISLQKNLLASIGSDFHSPSTAWCKLGMNACLPSACKPVWSEF